MAFDATVGGASANSYLLVAEADALAAADLGPNAAAWVAADAATKQTALQRATREVDAYLHTSGIARYSTLQALLYPRAVDVLNSTAFIPNPVRFAVYAQAKFLVTNAAELDSAMSRRAEGIQSGSEPNVSWSLAPQGNGSHLCDEALGYLQGAFAQGATIHSVLIGTDYTFPVLGDPGLDVLP